MVDSTVRQATRVRLVENNSKLSGPVILPAIYSGSKYP